MTAEQETEVLRFLEYMRYKQENAANGGQRKQAEKLLNALQALKEERDAYKLIING